MVTVPAKEGGGRRRRGTAAKNSRVPPRTLRRVGGLAGRSRTCFSWRMSHCKSLRSLTETHSILLLPILKGSIHLQYQASGYEINFSPSLLPCFCASSLSLPPSLTRSLASFLPWNLVGDFALKNHPSKHFSKNQESSPQKTCPKVLAPRNRWPSCILLPLVLRAYGVRLRGRG